MNQHPLTPEGDMADHAMKLHTSDGGYRVDTHRVIPACTGPCNQKGGEKCPHPEACQLPEEDARHVSGALAWPVYVVLAALAVAACWHIARRLAA